MFDLPAMTESEKAEDIARAAAFDAGLQRKAIKRIVADAAVSRNIARAAEMKGCPWMTDAPCKHDTDGLADFNRQEAISPYGKY